MKPPKDSIWLQRTSENPQTDQQLREVVAQGLLDNTVPAVITYDLSVLEKRLKVLSSAFPADTLHTVAIKSNPLLSILELITKAGFGLEAASSGELALAREAGCPASRVLFDSPAKTAAEIADAVAVGYTLNANSGIELERIACLDGKTKIGLRCNPAVAGTDRESATMVAIAGSKFGVDLASVDSLLERHRFVSGLHLHVGSQVATADDLVEAALRVVEIAERHPQIEWIDIGGGLPTRYRESDPGLTPTDYVSALKERVPELFNYSLATEVGRAIHANCAWAASKVEYVEEGRAIIHLGADFALRECYQPDQWWHDITVYTRRGEKKVGNDQPIDLYGPLCFSGDRIAHQLLLPEIEVGDIVVIHDVGAYTLGMWSRYCSRPMPAVVGFDGDTMRLLKRQEEPGALVRFWCGGGM